MTPNLAMLVRQPLELREKLRLLPGLVGQHRPPQRRERLAGHHAAEDHVPAHQLARDALARDADRGSGEDVLELDRLAWGNGADAVEAEPRGGDPLGDLALGRVDVGAGGVALDGRSSVAQLAVRVEPGEELREHAIIDAPALGMKLLEGIRKLVGVGGRRPVGDRPADVGLEARVAREPLLLAQTAALVLAAATVRTRSVARLPCHRAQPYEPRRTDTRVPAGLASKTG